MPAKCGIARVMDELPTHRAKSLVSLLSAPIPAAAVARELEAAGQQVSYQTVYRHRTGQCSCDTPPSGGKVRP